MSLLELHNVTKAYRLPGGEAHEVVRVDSMAVGEGEEVAVAGESGSGKTTLLNLVAGIVLPDAGEVVVAGREMTRMGEAERDRWRAATVGYVFQTFNLLQGFTCLENVLVAMSFGVGVDRGRAEALLRRVGLGDRLHHRPRQLSSGQQQRVAVARALANRPRLVLADEPTGNLDHRNAAEVMGLIRETCREAGAALLLVSHDRGVLGGFGRVERMEQVNRAGQPEEGGR